MPSAGTHSLLRSRTKGVRRDCDIVLLTSTPSSGFPPLPRRAGRDRPSDENLHFISPSACNPFDNRHPLCYPAVLRAHMGRRGSVRRSGGPLARCSPPKAGCTRSDAFYMLLEGL